MAPTGAACQAVTRWSITPLAASPASFQPSKAATRAGEGSLRMPLSSISHYLLAGRLPPPAAAPPPFVPPREGGEERGGGGLENAFKLPPPPPPRRPPPARR